MIYPIQFYNSPAGSIVILNKIFDDTIPVYKTIKTIEKSKNIKELIKSYLVLLYTNISKSKVKAKIVEFDTIRGPIYRLKVNNTIRPLREDGFPDPSFITKSKYKILEDSDFEYKPNVDTTIESTKTRESVSQESSAEVL